MKQIIIFTVLFLGTLFPTVATTYEEAMGENIQKMYSSKSIDELTAVANQFERIAAKETSQWLPGYYAAYSYVMILHQNMELTNEVKDRCLDKAQAFLDQLEKNFSNESEVFALQGLVYQMRILDASRGYKYSMLSGDALKKAEKLNPENPRVYYLRGSNTFYTPEQFGGGAGNAKPSLEKAKELFQTQKSENQLLPSWGKEHCTYLLEQCANK